MHHPDRQQVTLDDVARSAGVSRATASRVLTRTGPASPAARDRVHAAADELGYTPDPAARALVTGTGFRLVVAVTGREPAVLDDPYVHRVVSAAAKVCAVQGVGVALEWLPVHAPDLVRRFAEDRSVSGVLLVNTTEPLLDALPRGLGGRVTSIGTGSGTVPSFDVDNASATDTLARHLYASGRRRIAMVTGPRWLPCGRPRDAAFRGVMRDAGLPVRLVPGDFTAAGGQAATGDLLRRWPDTDAILAGSDAMALGALAALRQRGAQVPGDVAVTGFDDIPFASLSAPTLTTASHPVERIAADAAAAALGETPPPPATAYPSMPIHRESA
jgi:DNA-binding LacI/PurR family transcriptional regulator